MRASTRWGSWAGQLNYRGFACYPDAPQDGTSAVPPGGVVYHLLARCASVAEAAEVLEREVTITAVPLLGTVPTVHWAFTDETGESMVVEPEADGLRIYPECLGGIDQQPRLSLAADESAELCRGPGPGPGYLGLGRGIDALLFRYRRPGASGRLELSVPVRTAGFSSAICRPGRTEEEGVADCSACCNVPPFLSGRYVWRRNRLGSIPFIPPLPVPGPDGSTGPLTKISRCGMWTCPAW